MCFIDINQIFKIILQKLRKITQSSFFCDRHFPCKASNQLKLAENYKTKFTKPTAPYKAYTLYTFCSYFVDISRNTVHKSQKNAE